MAKTPSPVIMLCDDLTPDANQALKILVDACAPFWIEYSKEGRLALWVGQKEHKGLEGIKAFATEYRQTNRFRVR